MVLRGIGLRARIGRLALRRLRPLLRHSARRAGIGGLGWQERWIVGQRVEIIDEVGALVDA